MSLSFLPLAFALGLLSTVHCWGMCGGLLLAFAGARGPAGGGLLNLLGFNLGRITSYTLAGALTGAAADAALGARTFDHGHQGLQMLAAGVLIVSGLALLRWLPGRDRLARLGLALWRRLQPLTRALLPAARPHQRFLLGMVWGWLPCGFVYSMLALAAAQGEARAGALLMLAFGLGTLPGMLAAQAGLDVLRARLSRLHAPALAGLLLVASGVGLLWLQGPFANVPAGPHAAHHHMH
ncbi:MAG: sulfite exporter TauE/SafE family protein [Gammaproteobacteria bacterium]